jgi:putative flippase GtrA
MVSPPTAHTLKQFSSFALLGLFSAGIDFTLYVVLIEAGLDPIYGNILSSAVGILINYLLVSKFTFNVDYKSSRKILLFFLIATSMLFVMTLVLGFLINILSWDPVNAKIFSLPISAVIKFIINRRYTFI